MRARFSLIISLLRQAADVVFHPRYFWLGLLVLLLFTSGGIWLAKPHRRPIVLWFPSHRNGTLVPELRYIERKPDLAVELRLVLEELVLGSLNPGNDPVLAADVGFRLIGTAGKIFYIDFSSGFFFRSRNAAGVYTQTSMPPGRIIELVRKTLQKNYPGLDFIITIDGLEPETAETLAILQAKYDNLIDKGAWLTIIKANTDSNVRAL